MIKTYFEELAEKFEGIAHKAVGTSEVCIDVDVILDDFGLCLAVRYTEMSDATLSEMVVALNKAVAEYSIGAYFEVAPGYVIAFIDDDDLDEGVKMLLEELRANY